MRPALIAAVLTAFGLSAGAEASFLGDYTPILKADWRSRFPLTLIAKDKQLETKAVVKAAGCDIRVNDDDNLEFSGVDADRNAWKVVTEFRELGTAIYCADLDKNGIVDIVVSEANGGCGLAPVQVVRTIMFDKRKRPTLWGTHCYGEQETPKGLEDFLVLGRDPHCVLVHECIGYHKAGSSAFSYWRTDLYRADNARWRRFRSYRGHPVPMFVRYRFKPNHQLVKVIPADLEESSSTCSSISIPPQGKVLGIKEVKTTGGSGDVHYELQTPADQSDAYESLLYDSAVGERSNEGVTIAGIDTSVARQMLKRAYESGKEVLIPHDACEYAGSPTLWIVSK